MIDKNIQHIKIVETEVGVDITTDIDTDTEVVIPDGLAEANIVVNTDELTDEEIISTLGNYDDETTNMLLNHAEPVDK